MQIALEKISEETEGSNFCSSLTLGPWMAGSTQSSSQPPRVSGSRLSSPFLTDTTHWLGETVSSFCLQCVRKGKKKIFF